MELIWSPHFPLLPTPVWEVRDEDDYDYDGDGEDKK